MTVPGLLSRPAAIHTEDACRDCGLPVWFGLIDPAERDHFGPRRRTWITLWPDDSSWDNGGLRFNAAGFVQIAPANDGNLMSHKCPVKRVRCRYCGERVRVLQQPPGSAVSFAVVEPEPSPDGVVVINQYGYAVHDRARRLAGKRFRWHSRHTGRPS